MGGRRGNPSLRTRRWDAVVLGTSLPGLIAAIVLGRRGARVLVLEERGAERFPGLREPFLLTGAGPDGVLGACLRDLALPLIERKRLEPLPTSFQVVLPDARFDVGEPDWTSQELANWGFAEQRSAKNLLAALGSAGEAEREAMLAAPILRPPRLRSLGGRRSPPPSMTRMGATRVASETPRGMPDERKISPTASQLYCTHRSGHSRTAVPPRPVRASRRACSALRCVTAQCCLGVNPGCGACCGGASKLCSENFAASATGSTSRR